jgi:histidinol-phosphatase (PHP family)
VIGSIHFIGYFDDGKPWGIDGPAAIYDRGMSEIYNGDGKKAARDFYDITRKMIQHECPDIIGHMDKVRMHNGKKGNFFDETKSWYKKEIQETLDLIVEKNAIVEVNTRGMYKGYADEPYPSLGVLKEVHKRKIPIQLNSDSHHPDELEKGYRETVPLLKSIGFRTFRIMLNGQWQDVGFDENGLQV